MVNLSFLNQIPTPSEFEEPYFSTMQSFYNTIDASIWALADNSNLTFNNGGLFQWNASTAQVNWTAPINITGFTTPYSAVIQGPPAPGGLLQINEGEVAFFIMPRNPQQNVVVSPVIVSSRLIPTTGARLQDLKFFCANVGGVLLFPNGKSLLSGQSAVLFGGGSGTSIPPHQHQPAAVYEGLPIGTTTLDLGVTLFGYEELIIFAQYGVFSVGDTITGSLNGTNAVVTGVGFNYIQISPPVGQDYQVGETITGNSTILNVAVSAPAGTFTVGDGVTAGTGVGTIEQIFGTPTSPTGFYIKLVSGTFPGTGTLSDTSSGAFASISSTTSLGNPTAIVASILPPSNLLSVDLYRNGVLQAEDDAFTTRDYSINFSTGLITLHLASLANDRFVALRTTIPSGTAGNAANHVHLRLQIPIVTNGVVNLDMQLNSLTPSPNMLIDVFLFRNGLIQAEPADYSLDADTGIVTLVQVANTGEIFIADRIVA
jgi:hypothetical protein